MNYTITITEQERQILADGFGILARKLSNASPVIEDQHTNKPISQAAPPTQSAAPHAAPPGPPVAQTSTGTGGRDRWAKDRKGNELPNPEGCEAIDVHLWKTKQGEKWLQVTWQNNGQGYTDAKCFDGALWPWIIGRAGKRTRLYVVRRGQYLNVVGVCA